MTINPAADAIADAIRAHARAGIARMEALLEYADALQADDTLESRLGDVHTGIPNMVQIIGRIEEAEEHGDAVDRVIFQQFQASQRANARYLG